MPELHIHQTGTLDLDGGDPLACGAQIAEKLVTPLLADVLYPFDQDSRLLLWAGLLGSLSGAMAASIGPADARVVLDAAGKSVDRLDKAMPEAFVPAAKGVH